MPRFARLLAILSLTLASPVSAQDAANWVLRPGDALRVDLWREPKLSGEFPVDETGAAVLPLLGRQQVAGRPWGSLRDSLYAAYERELSGPNVQVLPLRRVLVLGAVLKPGAYYADPATTFATAVALAQGAAPEGDLRRIRVVRGGETLIRRAAVESTLAAANVQSGDQIFVDRRSWLDRNSAVALSTFVGLAGVIVTLIVFR